MIPISELTQKKKRENVKNKVVEICHNKILNKIQNKIENGLNPFEAYDQVFESFELEEEIILLYELEAEKANLIEELEIKPEEITEIKKKIEKNILDYILKKYNY
ncbi:MAG: hypothetical protein ACFFBP_09435 [Promethearchaeota archaeon]